MTTNTERVAAEIRRVDGNHTLGAGALAEALADAGLIMPDLPAPAYEGSTTWCVPGEHEWQTDTYKGEVMLEVDVEEAGNFCPSTVTKTWFMQRDEARALAMALLAAADYAERGQGNG